MKRLVRATFLVALCTAGCWLPASAAETWPTKSIRMVVPFPPGGGTDMVARALALKLSTRMATPVIVDNKPGAVTIIGTEAVVRAEPDGHTLLVSGSTSFTVNPALRSKLPYDPIKDLAPIAIVARAPLVLVVAANSPYKNLSDLIAAARAHPKTINYATFGSGSAPHLVGTLLEQATGISLQDVPYKGSSQVVMALIGGEIQLGIDTVASAAAQILGGKLRPLAIAGSTRSSLLPDVPTVVELKLPAAAFDGWYAVAVPARTPRPVVDRLVSATAAIMADPDMQAQIRVQGMEPVHIGPAAMRRLIDEEIVRYRAHAWRAKIVVE